MPKRIARLLPNGRETLWGVSRIEGRITAVIGEGETDAVRIDLTDWLDASETVSSSALADQTGVTITKANGGTYVDLTISGVTDTGEATLTITTSAGRVRVIEARFRTPAATMLCDDDYWRCL